MTNGLEKAKMAITEVCEALKTSDAIPRAIDAFRDFLLEKNKAYGNSIYEPVRVFTNASIDSLILVRLNDKATRLLKGESGGEDSFDDLLGYLILRKALPLYLTWGTKEGQEALDALHCGGFERAPVPGSVVTASLANRGLRVGMTYQEVRDNQWTQCEGGGFEHPVPCTVGDPCSACKFLDGALCKCGHPFAVHSSQERESAGRLTYWCAACDECAGFSLASWTDEPLPQVAVNIANAVNTAGVPWTAIPIDDGSEYGAVTITADEPKEKPTMTDEQRKVRAECKGDPCSCDWGAPHGVGQGVVFLMPSPDIQEVPGIPSRPDDVIVLPVSDPSEAINLVESGTPADYRATHEKKPRINRATWHETEEGKDAVLRVVGALTSEPVKSWYARDLADEIRVGASDVSLALAHLLSTGAIVNHGKAKGTRYAVAGFTDWPAPRQKKTDVADFVNVIGEETQ